MKGILCLIVICALDSGNSSAKLNNSLQAHPDDPKPIHRVYAEYKGPKRAALRFSRVLEVALTDHDLELVTDRGKAEAIVNVTIEEETGVHSVYGQVSTLTFSFPAGRSYTYDSCVSVTHFPGRSTVTRTGADEALRRSNSSLLTRIFLELRENDQNAGLRRTLMRDLTGAGYTLVSTREQADAVLESARIHEEEIPVTGLQQRILVNASVRVWPKYSFTSNMVGYFHVSVVKPVPEQARACSDWTGSDSDWLNMWNLANVMAKSLKE